MIAVGVWLSRCTIHSTQNVCYCTVSFVFAFILAITCPAGQVYEECSDKCYRSCADIDSMPSTCHTKCVEGCRCPDGEALDENNECIPIGLCPCTYKGLTFNSGYKEVRPGTKHLDLW